MREILFRGKHRDNGEWVYGKGVIPVTVDCYENGEVQLVKSVNYDELDYYQPQYDYEDVIPETVGQYILTNRKGKKIFEGDIVKVYSDCDGFFVEKHYINGVVKFDNIDSFNYMISFDHIRSGCQECFGNYGKDLEVIGNIYDNPELLEV